MAGERATGYWYDEQRTAGTGFRLLAALRDYRSAESAMRKHARESMGMGETDLVALRILLAAKIQGRPISPKDLAAELGISSASTTILVDRMEKRGHVVRQPHPHDRRGILLETTEATHLDVRDTLGDMHSRMIAAADSLSAPDAEVVIDFLVTMRRAIDTDR